MCTGKLKKNVLIKENVSLRLISEKRQISQFYMNALFIYLKIYKLKQFKNLPYFVYKKKLIAQDQIFYYMCFPKNKFKRA